MSPESLAKRKCQPCEGGVEPLPPAAASKLLGDVPGWELVERSTMLRRVVRCRDFKDAVGLIGRIADVAEAEDHHPDLHLTGYRRLTIELSTHSIGGLSENDFILAAKLNELLPA